LAILATARARGRNRLPGIPTLLESILRDATINFMLVFISHLLLLLFLLFAPVGDIRGLRVVDPAVLIVCAIVQKDIQLVPAV
jgi:hypothetical protein